MVNELDCAALSAIAYNDVRGYQNLIQSLPIGWTELPIYPEQEKGTGYFLGAGKGDRLLFRGFPWSPPRADGGFQAEIGGSGSLPSRLAVGRLAVYADAQAGQLLFGEGGIKPLIPVRGRKRGQATFPRFFSVCPEGGW